METEKPDNLHDSLDLSTYKENWTSRDGRTIILRSITSEDKRIEKELIDGLSLKSSRYRFFHVIKEATEEMVNQFCDIDYKNEIAIIAEYNSNDKKRSVGVVRLFIDPSLQTGEFAILVADNFQDSGLGTKFMDTLINIGREKGLKSIYGIVPADNIWLQGIWLPLRGYDFQITPLWAGIYMVPSSIGILLLGPLSGRLSDRYGARYFATGAMILTAVGFSLLLALPVNFKYPLFAAVIFLDGMSTGMFMAPNTAAIMNSLPPQHRGAGSGMRATLINVGSPLSMAIIFSLMVVGLNASMPAALCSGLTQNGIPAQIAQQIANAPPVGYLFAAFLGYNPLGTLIPAGVLNSLPPQQAATITSRAFFPQLIDTAFHRGLVEVLVFSIIMCLIGAAASWVRGGKYVYREEAKS